MALIQCPDCNKSCSDVATACPNCGRPSSAELRKRYKVDAGLLKKDAKRGDLEAINFIVRQMFEPVGANAEAIRNPLNSNLLLISLGGTDNPLEKEACIRNILGMLNTIKPDNIIGASVCFAHKDASKKWSAHLSLDKGIYFDTTRSTNAAAAVYGGAGLAALLWLCSAFFNALQNPPPPTLEEKMRAISDDKCLMYKIDCPKENYKWSPEMNRLIYDGTR